MTVQDTNYRTASQLSEVEKLEIGDLYKDPTNTVEEIAATYHLKAASHVCYIVKQLGIPMRRVVSKHMRRPYEEAPAASLNEEIEKARQHLEDLMKMQQARAIRFVRVDETTATVYGITENFVANEGVAKFRDWIEKNFAQHSRPTQ